MTPAGLPHSEILGSQFGYQLPEAYRRFLRPSSAPDAKASTVCPYQLGYKDKDARVHCAVLKKREVPHSSSAPTRCTSTRRHQQHRAVRPTMRSPEFVTAATPSGPNSVPSTDPANPSFHPPERSTGRTRASRRQLIDVPPMSYPSRTYAPSGHWTHTPKGDGPRCSLERR
jgi:hypothetical protein